MVASRPCGRLLAAIAVVGLCVPTLPAAAQSPAAAPVANQNAAKPLVRDVELGNGGLLVGRLLDANGRPLTDTEVTILSGESKLAETKSDADGVFAVSSLRGGVHQVVTPDTAQVCRLWTNGTAPPQSPTSIEVVASEDVVRGQYGPPPGNRMIKKAKVWATNPFVIGGVVAAAVAIPVALADDDGPHS
jgi:hypothetical protein